MPAHILDRYYLAITLLVTVGYQLVGFAVAWTLQFDKITDFTGGSNFFILALLTLLTGNTFYARNIVASIFVMLWATRLAGFLLYRVLKTGSDTRFDDIRSHFLKFLGFWIGQIVWVWVVSLPLIILNSPAISDPSRGGSNPSFGTACDIVGIILWAVGWLTESIADIQKFQYKQSNPPKDRPIVVGLWSWSRHPPYFGEMLCWWGVWLLCLSPTTNGRLGASARAAQYGAVVSPIFTVLLLMFASGVPTAEKPQARKFYELAHPKRSTEIERTGLNPGDITGDNSDASHERYGGVTSDAWTNYQAYLRRTSILVPLPPILYSTLPEWIKHTVLLDWGIYRYDPQADKTD